MGFRFPSPNVLNASQCVDCGGQLIRRMDDDEAVVRRRLQTYDVMTMPILQFFEVCWMRITGGLTERLTERLTQRLTEAMIERLTNLLPISLSLSVPTSPCHHRPHSRLQSNFSCFVLALQKGRGGGKKASLKSFY